MPTQQTELLLDLEDFFLDTSPELSPGIELGKTANYC